MKYPSYQLEKYYHIPVLLEESVEGLNLGHDSVVVDATFGGGGHSNLIIRQIPYGKLYAFDQDSDAASNIIEDSRFFFINHNYRYLKNFLYYFNVNQVDAIIGDLGLASHHIHAERGFSFMSDSKLDMRMNRTADKDAFSVVNEYDEAELARIFRDFGEIRNASKVAAAIVSARQIKLIETTGELRKIVAPLKSGIMEMKYLAQVFQAIRIEVNDELNSLREFLQSALDILRPGGRLVLISYHSIESRNVKNFLRTGNFEGEVKKDFYGNFISPFRLINKKAIIPSPGEIKINPRSRSAKLRIAEKI